MVVASQMPMEKYSVSQAHKPSTVLSVKPKCGPSVTSLLFPAETPYSSIQRLPSIDQCLLKMTYPRLTALFSLPVKLCHPNAEDHRQPSSLYLQLACGCCKGKLHSLGIFRFWFFSFTIIDENFEVTNVLFF